MRTVVSLYYFTKIFSNFNLLSGKKFPGRTQPIISQVKKVNGRSMLLWATVAVAVSYTPGFCSFYPEPPSTERILLFLYMLPKARRSLCFAQE